MTSENSKVWRYYDVNICFECGEQATEEHHIIPKVQGGKKTIPLCTSCHMKVHGLDGTKRADNHIENTKRGLDKIRAWDLFGLYQIIHLHNVVEISAIQEMFSTEFNHSLTLDQTQRLYNRLMEVDEYYLKKLFDKHIDSDLSFIWNESDNEYRFSLLSNELKKVAEHLPALGENNATHLAKEIFDNVNQEFKKHKRNQ